MIQISGLHKEFSGEVLFQDLNLTLHKGEKYGLVGRNGSGKSTLFSMILGNQSPDQGEITFPKNYKIGHLEQHINFSQKTLLEECSLALPAEHKQDLYLAEKLLFGLGFEQEDLKKNPKDFSGGFQLRINLCKALIQRPNLLLLDEPTNYLDILSLRWLKNFLRQYPGEVILITHDRDFMDGVATHILGIYQHKLKKTKGNTAKYYAQIRQEESIHEKTRLNQQKKKQQLESFIEKYGAKASKATQAQSKAKQIAKLDQLEKLQEKQLITLNFHHKPCPGKFILNAKNLTFNYPSSPLLFSHINLSLKNNDRVAIIGKNGKGKSTLLSVLAGVLQPVEGNIQYHPSTTIGHFAQTNTKKLSDEATILEEIMASSNDLTQTQARNICGSLLFSEEKSEKKIKVLSGGERNRVLLGKIMATKTNLLLLDEPTNHLDMEAIEILQKELNNYKGAVILVTHNESLLRKIATRLIIFHKNGAEFFEGTYDDFLNKIGWEEEEQETKTSAPNQLTKKEKHSLRAEIIKERSKLCSPLKKEITKHENIIIEEEHLLNSQHKKLNEATHNKDNEAILTISQKIGQLESKIDSHFEMIAQLEEQLLKYEEKFEAQLNTIEENKLDI
ncbi:MAG: ABC-F family ATP-binding cassette domain-containing protein [Bacteriovoracaceae bacterium]|jgi:ATP-binding cassette subfamily F protein 3|nr:ABC-F family ATP-binding cassette domain-containing protein [Bacteriovoracaceae bacterium]